MIQVTQLQTKWLALMALAGSSLVGLVAGYAVLGTAQSPPDAPPAALALPAAPAVPAAPALAVAPTPPAEPAAAATARAKPASGAARAGVPGVPTVAPPGADAADALPFVPARASLEAAAAPTDTSMLATGPGQFVQLDLATAAVKTLTIREGAMTRNGAATYGKFAQNPKVGALKGARPRVELLHVGYDREARPVVAHIRTTGQPPVEGIVALKIGEVFVPVLPERPAPAGLPE